MPEERFRKIEDEKPAAGIVRREEEKPDRFSRLEDPNGPPADAVAVEQRPKLITCPACGCTNQSKELYCVYCGAVFPDRAEKTTGDLKVYEMRCPACGKIGNRNQKACLWCGYRFVPTDEDILRDGQEIVLTIDGERYSSKDPYLPRHIKQAMVRIKKEGICPRDTAAVAETVASELRREQASVRFTVARMAENARLKVLGSSFLVGGFVLAGLGRVLIRTSQHAAGWAITLLVAGGICVIIGLATLGSAGVSADQVPGPQGPMRRGL